MEVLESENISDVRLFHHRSGGDEPLEGRVIRRSAEAGLGADVGGGGSLVVLVAVEGGELPDSDTAKLMDETLGSDRVHLVVRSAGDESAETVEVELFLGELGKDVRAVGIEAEHFG